MDLQSFDWSLLKVFVAVADTGSINAAAQQLGHSQAKVSRDIDLLERQIGQELFLRSARGMELTSAGQIVLPKARSMADAADALSSDVSELQGDAGGQVVIAAHDAMATYWLAPRLPEFHQSNPDIEIMLKVVQETPNLADGEADICLQYEPPNLRNVISRSIGHLHYMPFASRDYLDIHGVPESMYDAGKHRILLHSGYNKQVDAWQEKTPHWKAIVSNVLQSNSSTVILETCARGGGIAVMPSYMAETDRGVLPLPFKPMASIRFWLAYTERARNLRRCQPVLQWLRDCFNTDRYPWFREMFVPPPSTVDIR
jgi:DNA-binding transcriptional LysR family regulator